MQKGTNNIVLYVSIFLVLQMLLSKILVNKGHTIIKRCYQSLLCLLLQGRIWLVHFRPHDILSGLWSKNYKLISSTIWQNILTRLQKKCKKLKVHRPMNLFKEQSPSVGLELDSTGQIIFGKKTLIQRQHNAIHISFQY